MLSAWLLSAALLAPVPAPPRYCAVSLRPDYLYGVAYKALLRLDPACPPGGVGRVRKVSTLNRLALWRPQKPGGSPQYGGKWGWTLGSQHTDIPASELWTLASWVWQYWDGTQWRRVTRR